jgi:hypothetical protein
VTCTVFRSPPGEFWEPVPSTFFLHHPSIPYSALHNLFK